MVPFARGEVRQRVAPFVKWAGGKTALLSQYQKFLPASFETYLEPFVGGGAMFLRLQPERAVLSDINPRLMDAWRTVRDDLDGLLVALAGLKAKHDKAHFYASRTRLNEQDGLTQAQRAALFIYLNKTCFNGLYRVNRSGHFNVPMGRYKRPSVFDEASLRGISLALKDVTLAEQPFEMTLAQAGPGDFVYCDPPYHPISTTSNFTSYTRGGFSAADQRRLAQSVTTLSQRGVRVLVSNSSADLIRELYADFHIQSIQSRRRINSKASGRGPIEELLIRTW